MQIKKHRISQRIMVWFLPVIVIGGLFYPLIGYLVVGMMAVFLTLAFFKGRWWCTHLCPRGAFLDIYLSPISRKKPIGKPFTKGWFKVLVFVLLMGFVVFRLIQAGGNIAAIGAVFVVMCVFTTIISILLGIIAHQRSWCVICPMGNLQNQIGKIKKKK